MKTISSLFAKDLEFYHDKGGFSDYQKNLENSKIMFANNKTLQRELIRESLQVYPIKDWHYKSESIGFAALTMASRIAQFSNLRIYGGKSVTVGS